MVLPLALVTLKPTRSLDSGAPRRQGWGAGAGQRRFCLRGDGPRTCSAFGLLTGLGPCSDGSPNCFSAFSRLFLSRPRARHRATRQGGDITARSSLFPWRGGRTRTPGAARAARRGPAHMRPGAGPLAGEVQCWKQGSRAQLPQTESGPRTGVLGTPGAPGTPGARAGMERRVSTDCLRADNLDLRSLYYTRSRDRPWKKCF